MPIAAISYATAIIWSAIISAASAIAVAVITAKLSNRTIRGHVERLSKKIDEAMQHSYPTRD